MNHEFREMNGKTVEHICFNFRKLYIHNAYICCVV